MKWGEMVARIGQQGHKPPPPILSGPVRSRIPVYLFLLLKWIFVLPMDLVPSAR